MKSAAPAQKKKEGSDKRFRPPVAPIVGDSVYVKQEVVIEEENSAEKHRNTLQPKADGPCEVVNVGIHNVKILRATMGFPSPHLIDLGTNSRRLSTQRQMLIPS